MLPITKSPVHEVAVCIAVPAEVTANPNWDDHLQAVFAAAPHIPVRLAGLSSEDGRLVYTFAVSIGTSEEIAERTERARNAASLVDTIITDLSMFDAALCAIPEDTSDEALLADDYLDRQALVEEMYASYPAVPSLT